MIFLPMPPRRPSAVFRYTVLASVLLLLAFSFSVPMGSKVDETVAQSQQQYRQHSHTRSISRQMTINVECKEEIDNSSSGSKNQSYLLYQNSPEAYALSVPDTPESGSDKLPTDAKKHPIDRLIKDAEAVFQSLIAEETDSLEAAAEAYRKRRGRHPPPGFDVWHAFATENKAVIVEEFWDQIYRDLHPFWAVPAMRIRHEVNEMNMKIKVRNGHATTTSNWFWTQIWLEMIQSIERLLPDMDIALNPMDEPRIVVPWEVMREYVAAADHTVYLAEPKNVICEIQSLGTSRNDEQRVDRHWVTTASSFWDIVRRGCEPTSPVQLVETMVDYDGLLSLLAEQTGRHMRSGFVANSTLSRDICHQPDLQGLNGIFIEPLSISSTPSLLAVFGGSKLSINNDILLPAPMYWAEETRFMVSDPKGISWEDKVDGAIWRGVATGGRNRATNWRGFHRHRFVAMNNGTSLKAVTGTANAERPSIAYGLAAQRDGRLGEWVDTWSDCAFVDLMCAPEAHAGTDDGAAEQPQDGQHDCPYADAYYSVRESMPLQEQFGYKYLPDIDGNSFSGRYLTFLRSSSLPIKATIWKEWHDDRLVAWKHYVPMDNRYGDWLGLMEYFLGYNGSTNATGNSGPRPSHDEEARRIAADGQAWANRVTRREDMQVYVLRLLLEYARVSDDRRELLGWVGDLESDDEA